MRLIEKGRRAETRGKAMQGCVGAIFRVAIAWLARGWWLMLAVGIIHAEWVPALPTLGYWWAVAIVALLSGTFSVIPPKTPAAKS
jgi:hypothetical protein